MIVRDAGEAWQVVLQPDHAELSAQLCRAWGSNGLVAPAPAEPLEIASRRHDDGWAVWERSPSLNPDTGAPRGFLQVQVPLHLAFYRACITAVADEDPYAGLLVSMHGAGIYRERYGTQPGMSPTHAHEVQELVDEFVAEQEASHSDRAASLGLDEQERWVNYKFVQLFDRLSLYFCLKDVEQGASDELGPVPVDYEGAETTLQIDPVRSWQVRLDPYPFVRSPLEFELRRRVLPKGTWADDRAFRRDFLERPVERTRIVVER